MEPLVYRSRLVVVMGAYNGVENGAVSEGSPFRLSACFHILTGAQSDLPTTGALSDTVSMLNLSRQDRLSFAV
jgi:hypothetical protein